MNLISNFLTVALAFCCNNFKMAMSFESKERETVDSAFLIGLGMALCYYVL
jgi:hypothetical protein